MRIDMFVKEKFGLSRQKARQLINDGEVRADGKVVSKPSMQVSEDMVIEISEAPSALRYVGRGGLKLEGAIEAFGLELKGLVCIDIGASTGGFTDCMLKNGASKVYAVDVGTEQLAQVLKDDERVISLENTNITDFECEEKADFVAADVSFVSLGKILPEISRLLGGERAVVLVKPQFEAGREYISKNGIVKGSKVHKNVLMRVIGQAEECGLYFGGLELSPIKGGDGNTEYLLLLERHRNTADIRKKVEDVVGSAGVKFG